MLSSDTTPSCPHFSHLILAVLKVWMLEAKPAVDRDTVEHALVAVLAASSWCRMVFRKDEHGVVNAVQLLDLATSGSWCRTRVWKIQAHCGTPESNIWSKSEFCTIGARAPKIMGQESGSGRVSERNTGLLNCAINLLSLLSEILHQEKLEM